MIAILSSLLSLLLIPAMDAQTASGSAGTATIRGRVTDKESGLPIARAIVQVSRRNDRRSAVALTDSDGRYELTGLVPGEYLGFVQAGAFRETHLRQAFSNSSDPRRPFVLRAGEIRADLNVALPRAFAITVRVVDDWGGPLSQLELRLKNADSGRDIPPGPFRRSDDQGRVRAFGLSPGRYVVCVAPVGLGSSTAKASRPRERFLRTCYPSTTVEAEAEPVHLEQSDIDDLQIVMRRGRTFTISGTVVDSTGAPAPSARAGLDVSEPGRSFGSSVSLRPDGSFTFENVPPGQYALTAFMGGKDSPEHARPFETAHHPFSLDEGSSDLEGIVLRMVRTIEVRGRVRLEDPSVPFVRPGGMAPLLIEARLADDYSPGTGSGRNGSVGPDLTFTLDRMFGPRLFQIYNVPRGWHVKSILYGTRDIFETPTEFKDGDQVDVVLSTRGAAVSGRVLDERGEPVPRALVMMYPSTGRWRMHQVSLARTSEGGVFRVGPQRGGEYYVLALPPDGPSIDPRDYDRLTRLAEVAERVTLRDDEERTVDVRLMTPR